MEDPTIFDILVTRNIEDVYTAFKRNPDDILVSVQIEEEQKEHLNSGLVRRSRRLIPISLLARMLKEYDASL